MNIAQIIALAKKEFLALLRDSRSRMVLIAPPIFQMLIFGFAASYDINNVPIAVYNQDQGVASREYISKLNGSPNFEITTIIAKNAEIAPLINNREVLLVVNIEPNFSDHIAQGSSGGIQVILDGRNSNTASIAMNYLATLSIAFNQKWNEDHGITGTNVALSGRYWFNENLQSRWFIIPGILGMLILVVTLLVTALSVAREREAGTFDQLLVTPMRPVEILIGKAIPGIVVGIIEATIILVVIVQLFEIPLRGDIGALYLGIVLFLLSATGVGLMISAISVTQQQAILGAFLFLVPAVILSGFSTPIANMPEVIQWLTYLNPLRYFLIIVRGVFLEGNSYGLLIDQYWPMLIISIVSLMFSGWLFKHRMY
ncbi:ABC transporter permease [Leucothrix arctica]|uniref:Antibiotic ABC transporter permease n=1 Tax=Leucothrix arctica TaxID=1481894 RepID=A0A317C5G0_9GAMM|nr:ABC transporter permease [Leucothrix arctica]PWQ93838.1 antibiotic ABC transporter permease [Leucothrix arctica]